MAIQIFAKYRLNYKSFGKRCKVKEIQNFVDSVLRSFYNLGIEPWEKHKQLDFKDISNDKIYISTIENDVSFALRLINTPFGIIDLYEDDVIRCGYDVE